MAGLNRNKRELKAHRKQVSKLPTKVLIIRLQLYRQYIKEIKKMYPEIEKDPDFAAAMKFHQENIEDLRSVLKERDALPKVEVDLKPVRMFSKVGLNQ